MSVRQFESQLQRLDDAVRQGVDGVVAISEAREALNCLVSTNVAAIVLCFTQQNAETRQVVLATSSPLTSSMHIAIAAAESAPEEFRQQCVSDPAVNAGTSQSIGSPNASSGKTPCIITCRRSLTPAIVCVVVFEVNHEPEDQRLTGDAVLAITDCLLGFASRKLIADLQEQQDCRKLVDPILHELLTTANATECARRFVDRATSLLPETRISVCKRSGQDCAVLAVTGSISPDASAAAVRHIQQLATELTASGMTGHWIIPGHPSNSTNRFVGTNIPDESSATPGDAADSSNMEFMARCTAEGINRIRCEPISSDGQQLQLIILLECFHRVESASESLVRTLLDCYQTAIRQQRFQETAKSHRGLLQSPARWIAACVLAVLFCLLVIPSRFEIEVQGQLFPQERRRIFAPDDGLIEEVLVQSDQRIESGAPLLKMRNPERELELNRVLGEIDTTASRLQAIRTTRSGTGNRSSMELAELGSEELQMEQKLKTLRDEQGLIERQIESLTLKSPIAGIVYQRRLQEQLTARPVQRGQMLLEIGDDARGWQLELMIPDGVAGYVRSAGTNPAPRVDFVRSGELRSSTSTSVSSISLGSHIEEGQLGCLAFARIEPANANGFRPGESVTARIDCGRRSLGFVWFRELIEFWQKKRFAWF